MHRSFFVAALALAAAAPVPASKLDPESNAFMSGLYLCRVLQTEPQNTGQALRQEVWAPAPQGGYRKESARVFFSQDQKICYVQTPARIDLAHLEDWMELTGALDGRAKRYAWNETRRRPVRKDAYRVWRWDSWRSASGVDKGILSHEVIVLPGATQNRPGEQAVTASISYRLRKP